MKIAPLILCIALVGCGRDKAAVTVADPAADIARKLAAALSAKDWGAIYDLGSAAEFQETGITRDQFTGILLAVSKDVTDFMTGAKVTPLSLRRTTDTRYYSIGNGAASPASDLNGQAPGFLLTVRLEGTQWRALVMPLIGAVNLYTKGEPKQRWLKLAAAMRSQKVERLFMIETRTEITAERLESAAAGKISAAAIGLRMGEPTE